MIQASSHDDFPSQSEVLDSKAESDTVTSCRQGQPQSSHQVTAKVSSESTSHLNLMQSKHTTVMGDDVNQKDGNQQSPFNSSSRSASPPSIPVPASHRLRAEISEKDLFATFNFMDDDTDFEEDFRADRSNSLDDTSSTTSGSGDSFGVESLQDMKCNDAIPEPSKNASNNNKLANFLEGDKHVTRSTSRGGGRDNKNGLVDNVPGEEEDGRSMSIMSINSLPYATMEERSEDDEQFDDDDDHDGSYGDRNMHRPMRSLASSAVMSTPAAYFALLEEHEKLLEQNDELQEVQARKKAEKNQLHKVLVSKEEEYVERRDRLEWLQSRLDFLEVELMKERANSNCSNSRAMNPLRSKQKAGWEALDSEVSRLDLLRSENKRLVYKLQEQPEVTQADVKMEMRLQRRRKKIMQLEILEAKLKEDVEILRGVDKACKDYDDPV